MRDVSKGDSRKSRIAALAQAKLGPAFVTNLSLSALFLAKSIVRSSLQFREAKPIVLLLQ